MEGYRNEEGKYGVVISPGFGAGFSTWNDSRLAYDKRIVGLALQYINKEITAEELKELIESYGYDKVYISSSLNLEVVWVEPYCYFRIKEYDGSESIEFLDEMDFTGFNSDGQICSSRTIF